VIRWLKDHDYGLGIAFAALWIVSGLLHFHGEWWVSQWPHGEAPWQVEFYVHTFENWQSEFLQVASLIVLTTYLIYKGSPESRDGDEALKQKVDAIYHQQVWIMNKLDGKFDARE
jgi:hypothetical protein